MNKGKDTRKAVKKQPYTERADGKIGLAENQGTDQKGGSQIEVTIPWLVFSRKTHDFNMDQCLYLSIQVKSLEGKN